MTMLAIAEGRAWPGTAGAGKRTHIIRKSFWKEGRSLGYPRLHRVKSIDNKTEKRREAKQKRQLALPVGI